ncbi:MAG: carboxylesterase family protein, partial [Chloroflexota bacterium]
KVSREEKVLGAFYPVIDGYVLPDSPFTAFAEQRQAKVPILVGSNADEGSLIHPMMPTPLSEYIVHEIETPGESDKLPSFMREAFGEDLEELLTLYPGLETRNTGVESEFLGDSFFGSTTRYYAECHAKAGQPAYFYMFTRTPPSAAQTIGAFHAAELSFVHGTNTPVLPLTKQDLGLSRQMIRYWTQFAKTADPNQRNLPLWDTFNPDDPEWMVLGTDFVGMTAVDREEKYRIFNDYTYRLVQQMRSMRELV